MPGFLPSDGDAAFQHKISILDRARITADPDALGQVDHVHAVLTRRNAVPADVSKAAEPGIPDRRSSGIAHDMPCEFLLARMVAGGIEIAGVPQSGPKAARSLRIAAARVTDIDRRFRHPGADADRHQYRLDPVVAKAMWLAGLVQHHVFRAQSRLDHLGPPHPTDGQHALKHKKMFDDLVRMAGRVLADRLMHQTQSELPRLKCARVIRLGRAAGAYVAHLRPFQFGETAASREGVPVEALVGITSDKTPHLLPQTERVCWHGNGHSLLLIER